MIIKSHQTLNKCVISEIFTSDELLMTNYTLSDNCYDLNATLVKCTDFKMATPINPRSI